MKRNINQVFIDDPNDVIASGSGHSIGSPDLEKKDERLVEDELDDSGGPVGVNKKKIKRQKKSNPASVSSKFSVIVNVSESDSESSDEERRIRSQVDYVETVQELNRIRLSRSNIVKWIHWPFFSEVAKGCFVRIGTGGGSKNRTVYQVAEVLEVVEGHRVYNLGNTSTNKVFKLRLGTLIKTFRLEYVGEKDFEVNEFNKWKKICQEKSVVRPTLEDIENKAYQLNQAANYEPKEEDIDYRVSEKAKFRQYPVNFATRKFQLMEEKETAIKKGDEKRVKELTREITDLNDRVQELDKKRSKSSSRKEYVNQWNPRRNFEQEEVRGNKGKEVEDPFTSGTKPIEISNNAGKSTLTTGDLFNAHDFDIKIELNERVALPNLPIVNQTVIPPNVREVAPRRTLNLEDYKRKRGLI